jgi:putative DNA primase/helicase
MKPRVQEFRSFIDRLLGSAPPGYIPWLFRIEAGTKQPIPGLSWKSPSTRLTIEEAEMWLEQGGNVGIAGTTDDPLVNMDCDGGVIQRSEIKPTLMVRTRSRVGVHAFYFCGSPKLPNIPTDDAGEVRSLWEYVVAAGSWVKTDPATVPEAERENAGHYTIEEDLPAAWITYAELPKVFRDVCEAAKARQERKPRPFDPKKATGQHSALFDITAEDVVVREGGDPSPSKRWPALWHDSETGINFSLSTDGLIHCWRHLRSFNGLQALTVLSGYQTCNEAGSPHSKTVGWSRVTGDDGAILFSWLYAKKHGYIAEDDPCPTRALAYIAKKHLGYTAKEGEPLPREVYRKVLNILEVEY